MSTSRLFVALPLPESIRALFAGLGTPGCGFRWTAADQLHLTLRFLGDTPAVKIDPLTARLAAIRVEPFLLPLEGVGAFPPKSAPHVLWLGLGSGHPRLHQLRQRVDDALLAAGVEADLRHFHPHVTLARCAGTPGAATAAAHWLKTHRDFAGPSFLVESFELRASELHPSGALHRTLAAFPLAK
ncbi:MAG TPA: RNA 2',3'-cyclic phosphodiesterase [Opitutus sp.]|nr:RNA 2',3'-cyclic phosphodiesterase [Opitutus sp.]